MGVSEMLQLLKDVDEDGIEIQVVSLMATSPSMVCPVRFLSKALNSAVKSFLK